MFKKSFILFFLLLFAMVSIALATTITFNPTGIMNMSNDIPFNKTAADPWNFSIKQIGTQCAHTVNSFHWSDLATNASKCEEAFRVQYGDTVALGTSTEWVAGVTSDSTIASAATSVSAKFARLQMYHNDSYTEEASAGANCTYSSISLTYTGGCAFSEDLLEGLPNIGSGTGGMLSNLAPGVGAFILILGIFAAITGLFYAVVTAIKGKIGI